MSPYTAEWESAFGTQGNDWDSLTDVPFSGVKEKIYMTKGEVESYINRFTENKDAQSLNRIKQLLQEGSIVLVPDSDEEPPKPKVRVRTRTR